MQNFLQNLPDRKPSFCCIEMSSSCISKCKMCSIWKNKRNPFEVPALTLWRDFIDDFCGIAKKSAVINFAGGEPLSDGRNLELIKFCSENSIYTTMCTNGFLIDKPMAGKIAESGLKVIIISLDGLRNTHEFLRGVTGCYDKIMEAINYLDVYRDVLEIGIQPVIFGCNLDEIIKLTEWADMDSRIKFIHFQVVSQPFDEIYDNEWFKKNEYSFLWPQDVNKAHKTIDELIALKTKGYKISNSVKQFEVFKRYLVNPNKFIRKDACNVDFFLNIDPLGEIYMCRLKESIGNIKKNRFKDIWHSMKTRQVRQDIRNCSMNCHVLVNCCYEEE